jgi:OmpA-OmpF porin, OOP family
LINFAFFKLLIAIFHRRKPKRPLFTQSNLTRMPIKTLAWIALIVWMGGSTYWHVCKIKQLCDGPTPTATYVVPPLSIVDAGKLDLSSPMNFGFKKSMADPNFYNLKKELDSLASYLKTDSTRKTTITGLYSSIEQNTSSFADLGLARADAIMQYLVQAGVPAGQLGIASRMIDLSFSADDSTHGMEFGFTGLDLPKTEQALADAEVHTTVFEPMDLYFESAKSDYIKTGENDKFLAEAKQYLAENKDKKLLLTGHTDNESSDASNLRLSKKRVAGVLAAFKKTGINPSQLVTDAKGESEPKASNDTPDGRRANRRVSIVVQ